MRKNPISFKFENEILSAYAKGELLFEDIVEHYKELFTHPDFFVGIPAVYDFIEVTEITGDMNFFEQTVQDMGDSNVIKSASYVAILVSAENNSMNTIFNAYSQMMDYTLMNVNVFHCKTMAMEWLKKQV